ncbi:MAG: hypothetical protein AAF602_32735, partial [Myxococcota bacterium]
DKDGRLLQGSPTDNGPVGRDADRAAQRFTPQGIEDASPSIELTERGKLRLNAVAIYDASLGGMRERVWTVEGQGAASVFRAGAFRRLGDDEVVTLGATAQVSPPRQVRDGFAVWTPVSPP